jgi:hypothetical protein
MMDEAGFRKFLKGAGKKEHVIEGLVKRVRLFEKYLAQERLGNLESVTAQSFRDYGKSLSQSDTKKSMRGLALYFRFRGSRSLAAAAGNVREVETAKNRRKFKLGEFLGVNPKHIEKLAAVEIVTVNDMLAHGDTPDVRRRLAKKTSIPLRAILELVKLSDLSRLGAIKSVRARLYHDAGLDTPDKFVEWEPEDLRQMLVDFVERSGFDGIAPLPKEIRNTIISARRLPKVIQY